MSSQLQQHALLTLQCSHGLFASSPSSDFECALYFVSGPEEISRIVY